MYDVLLSDSARAFFENAAASLQRRLDRCFDHLRNEPRRHRHIIALKGNLAGYYRYRVGDYRVEAVKKLGQAPRSYAKSL